MLLSIISTVAATSIIFLFPLSEMFPNPMNELSQLLVLDVKLRVIPDNF